MTLLLLFVLGLFVYMLHLSAKMSDIEKRLDNFKNSLDSFNPGELPSLNDKKAEPAGQNLPEIRNDAQSAQRNIDEIKITALPVIEKEPEAAMEFPVKPQEKFSDNDEKKPVINWELFTGVKLFAWLGGFTAFLGLVFFTKYAFDGLGLVPRICICIAVGLILIFAGMRTRSEKLKITGDVLSAIGIVFVYVSVYVAGNIYYIVHNFTAALLMIATSIGTLDISLRKNSKYISVLAAVCGYLTPILLAAGKHDISAVFIFTLIITITIMAIALKKDWSFLIWFCGAGVFIILSVLFSNKYAHIQSFEMARICEAFCIIFTVFALISVKKFKSENDSYKLAPLLYNICSLVFVLLIFQNIPDSSLSSGYQMLELLLVISVCNAALALNDKYFEKGFILSSGIAYIFLFAWTLGFLNLQRLWMGLGSYFILFIISAALPCFAKRNDESAQRRFSQAFDVFLIFIFMLLGAAMIIIRPVSPDIFIISGAALSVLAFLLLRINKTKYEGSFFLASLMLFILQLLWQLSYSSAGNPYYACLWYFIVFTLFFTLVFTARKYLWQMTMPWFTAACSGVFQCLLVYLAARNISEVEGYFGIIPAFFAVIFGLSLAYILSFGNNDDSLQKSRTGIFTATTLLFITMIFPAQFQTQWLDISWALEAAVLIGLFKFIDYKPLKYWGFWIFIILFFKNLIPDTAAFDVSSGSFLNWYLYVYAILIAAMFIGAHFWQPAEEKHCGVNNKNTLLTFAVVLLFILLNIEIAAFFADGAHINFSFNNSFAQNMTYTLCWGLFAIILFVSGIIKELKAARVAGLSLLSVTTLKLFLYDLWSLGQLYKIVSLFGLAIMLILVSFLYQKYIGKINKNSSKKP